VKVPEDLRGKAPGYITADLINPKLFESIGGITPKPSDVVEFLPALQQGTINVLLAPSLAAEQLQWTSRIDHMNTGVAGFGVGATVLSQKQLDALTRRAARHHAEDGYHRTTMLGGIIRGQRHGGLQSVEGQDGGARPDRSRKGEWEKAFRRPASASSWLCRATCSRRSVIADRVRRRGRGALTLDDEAAPRKRGAPRLRLGVRFFALLRTAATLTHALVRRRGLLANAARARRITVSKRHRFLVTPPLCLA